MKLDDLRQETKRTSNSGAAGLPNRASDAALLTVQDEEGSATWFWERRKFPTGPDFGPLPLSFYQRTVNELRRENDRLKRELALLQRKSDLLQVEPDIEAPLRQLSDLVERVVAADFHESSMLSSLRSLHRALEQKLREIDPRLREKEIRSLVVETMRLSLELWLESTRSSKAELARRSGQWSVYVNQDGWERTQGLDRYLEIVTLPDNPRMKKVLRTADFVLLNCSEPDLTRQRLEEALLRLRTLQRPFNVTS